MPFIIGSEEARKNPLKRDTQFGYFEYKGQPDMPHATWQGHNPGAYYSEEHYHENDQFQIVVEGSFRMGKHELTPYCLHFTRAYTPYGPLVADADSPGFTFMVMRARRDGGAMKLSKKRQDLARVTNRAPWQVSQKVTFPAVESRPDQDVWTEPVPNVKDEHGLSAYTVVLKPDVKAQAPSPSPRGDGQYLVVVKGSLLHVGVEHKAVGLVFVKPEETAFELHAGAEGAEVIVLNFPERTELWAQARPEKKQQPASTSGLKKWQCVLCEFSYNEAKGMPEDGIAPGTRWEDVPETWICPDCSASKSDFEMVEVTA